MQKQYRALPPDEPALTAIEREVASQLLGRFDQLAGAVGGGTGCRPG
jgi:hypothetical protein